MRLNVGERKGGGGGRRRGWEAMMGRDGMGMSEWMWKAKSGRHHGTVEVGSLWFSVNCWQFCSRSSFFVVLVQYIHEHGTHWGMAFNFSTTVSSWRMVSSMSLFTRIRSNRCPNDWRNMSDSLTSRSKLPSGWNLFYYLLFNNSKNIPHIVQSMQIGRSDEHNKGRVFRVAKRFQCLGNFNIFEGFSMN